MTRPDDLAGGFLEDAKEHPEVLDILGDLLRDKGSHEISRAQIEAIFDTLETLVRGLLEEMPWTRVNRQDAEGQVWTRERTVETDTRTYRLHRSKTQPDLDWIIVRLGVEQDDQEFQIEMTGGDAPHVMRFRGPHGDMDVRLSDEPDNSEAGRERMVRWVVDVRKWQADLLQWLESQKDAAPETPQAAAQQQTVLQRIRTTIGAVGSFFRRLLGGGS